MTSLVHNKENVTNRRQSKISAS